MEQEEFLPVTDSKNQDIIEKTIKAIGRWQIFICCIVCLVKIPVAWIQLSIVFIAPPVIFNCFTITNITNQCYQNCSKYEYDRSLFTETIITEWDLVCERSYLSSLVQTVTMLGILSGNMLFGYFSDRFGRRNPLIIGVILQVLCGVSAALSHWFPLFLVFRFLTATATGGTMITSFVLVMEIVGARWRTPFGIFYQIPFSVGHVSLPLFAYFIRDWRMFHLAISLPSILLLGYYWLLPESPRWLLTVGRTDKAIKVLEKAATTNHLTTDNIKNEVISYSKTQHGEQNGGNIIDLIRTPIMRTYTFSLGFNWFASGLCFFGGAQFVGQLGGNIFINVALSALIQIPGILFSIWSLKFFGRRKTLIYSNLLASISCFLIGVVPKEMTWLSSALSCADMFSLAISFPTAYIYSGEVFPTVVRNVGVGTSSMFARVGSMVAPFVAGLVVVKVWLPMLVFGLMPLVGAGLCTLLPETLDCKLPDTIEEAERMGKKEVPEPQADENVTKM